MINAVINMLASVALFAMMATVGLGVNLKDVLKVAGDWRLSSRAAIANFVLVPTIALGLLVAFRPAPMVAAGFLIAIVCPGAPFGPPLTALARGNVCASVGLMAILAGSSAIVAPLLLGALLPHLMTSSLMTTSLLHSLEIGFISATPASLVPAIALLATYSSHLTGCFPVPGFLAAPVDFLSVVAGFAAMPLSLASAGAFAIPGFLAVKAASLPMIAAVASSAAPLPLAAAGTSVIASAAGGVSSSGAGELTINPLKIVSALMFSQFLPLCLGLGVRYFRPAVAQRWRPRLSKVSAGLNLLLIALILTVQWRMLETIRTTGYLGMAAMVGSTLLTGWLLGGRDPVMRKTMAITTANRNVGVALVITSASFPGTVAVPAATAYALFQIFAVLLVAGAWGRLVEEEEAVEKAAA